MRLCYTVCSLLLLLPLKYEHSNHLKLRHPHCKYFPDEVTPNLMYTLIMNTALFEETWWDWVTVEVEFLWCCVRILVVTLINAKTYWSSSPSSNSSHSKYGQYVAVQLDRLYTAAICEGRAHLKCSIKSHWIFRSVKFEMFVTLWISSRFWTHDL